MRLISICPSNTELIAYLGLTDKLVGVDNYSDWPKEIEHLPRLGPDLKINMDKLAELKPDLVIASLSVPGMERNIEQLEKRQIPHLVLKNPQSLEEIKQSFLVLAAALDVTKRGEQLVNKFDAILSQYETLSKKAEPVTLYWEWWPNPVFTPGRQNWLTYISKLAGGKNIFETEDVASFQTTWEDVFERNPDHICLVWTGINPDKVNPELVKNRPNWRNLEAIKNNRIHILEEALYCRPSLKIIEGLAKLAALLHPQIFPPYEGKDPLL